MIKQKIDYRGKKLRRLPKKYVSEYFEQTSLHGFHFINNKKSSVISFIFWGIVCIVSTAFCIYLISLQLQRYNGNRITTNIASIGYPIWKVPFPAVTVCNYNIVYKSSIIPFMKILRDKNFTEFQANEFFFNLSSFIKYDLLESDVNLELYRRIIKTLQANEVDIDNLMSQVAHPCEKLIKQCSWLGKPKRCDEIFKQIKTSSGYCCSFNYVGVSDNLHLNENDSIYVVGIGPKFGLEFYIDTEPSEYMSPIQPIYGAIVLVQESHQYPDTDLESTTVYPGTETTFAIKPSITIANEDIRKLHQDTRICMFSNEGNIGWSNVYTFQSCMSECKATSILEACQCVPFYYPINGHFNYCTVLDVECLKNNEAFYVTDRHSKLLQPVHHTGYKKWMKRTETLKECQCYPECNDIEYFYKVDQKNIISLIGFETSSNLSKVNVFFSTRSCVLIEKSIYLSWDTILASIGGIFGLCLGGSIISLIELFYFLLKGLCYKIKTKLTKNIVKSDMKPPFILNNGHYEPKLYLSDFYHIHHPSQKNYFKNMP